MGYSNCNTVDRVYNPLSEALFQALSFGQNCLLKERAKIAVDNIVLMAAGKAAVYQWLIGAADGDKPAGNTLQDNSFKGITIDQVLLIAIDNELMNNPAAQGITLDATTGTFDFTAIDGLKTGGPSGISILLNTVKV